MASILNNIKQGLLKSNISTIATRSLVYNTSKQIHLCSCQMVTKQKSLHSEYKHGLNLWNKSVVGPLGCIGPVRFSSKKVLDDQAYESYQEFDTPSPFKRRQPLRYGYEPRHFRGGVLPRPKGKYEDIPVTGTKRVFPQDRDAWTSNKALFGQNDYIDILGDGNIHPAKLINAPPYIKAFKGAELERLIRRMNYQGRQMQYLNPTKYNLIQKRIWFLYKRRNNYRKSKMFRGGRREANRGRLHSPKGALDKYIYPMKFKGW